MARDYAKVSARFWTGDTGRQLRALGAEAQVVALYLVTGPASNMEGLYYLALPTLVHETGLTHEGASKALRSLGEVGFAHYDEVEEVVWVPEMARHQVDEELKPNDNRIKGITKTLASYRKCRFYRAFIERYRVPFNLAGMPEPEAPPKALPSPSQGSIEALRSQEQEQEQEQKKAAAARAGARDGAMTLTGPGVAEAAPPPPAAEAAPGPASIRSPTAPLAAPPEPELPSAAGEAPSVEAEQASDLHPGTAGPEGAPPDVGTPPFDPTPGAVGHPAEAATPTDEAPRRPLLVLDLAELGPLAAQVRAQVELAGECRFILAAPERKQATRDRSEVAVEALGVERATEICTGIVARRKRHGIDPPKAWAYFVEPLEEAVAGGNPCPPEIVGVDLDQVAEANERERAQRWAPLLEQMPPSVREAFEADKARMLANVKAQGLWTSEERRQLEQAEGFLWTKWSGRMAAGGG